MKFKVGSQNLYSVLSGVSKVINAKNAISALDNFKMSVKEGIMTVSASDTENTLEMTVELTEHDHDGEFLVNARRMADIAKELPDVDVEIVLDEETYKMNINYPGGTFDLIGSDPVQYPQEAQPDEAAEELTFLAPSSQVIDGIEHTMFAVSNDEIRPQMTGIFWDIKEAGITFVATDTRKLVRYINNLGNPGITASFILPVKPAVILKTLLSRDEDVNVTIKGRGATFQADNLKLTCRFVKGNYPDYNRVIPKNNPIEVTVDRKTFAKAVRRVSICADPGPGMIKFKFVPGSIQMKVDDPNLSTFAFEEVPCDFQGKELIIGFGASYIIEILNVIGTENVVMRFADASRPGLFLPDENAERTDFLAILMPMTVQQF